MSEEIWYKIVDYYKSILEYDFRISQRVHFLS